MTNIEQLKKETDEIKKGLEELKNNISLSETEKKDKADALKTQAEATKKKIEKEIHSLENKTDDESKKKKEEAETLLNSFNEIMDLYNSILNNSKTTAETTSPATASTITTQGVEEKGFFGKIGEGLGNMWGDVTSGDKRKEQPGKNLLYVAGVGLTGYAAYKGVKVLWNRAFGKKKKDEESESESSSDSSSKKDTKEEEKSFWDKPVGKFIKGAGAVLGVGTGVYYVAHGLYTQNRGLRDLWDWEKGKKLEFDTALEYCKGAIANQDNKEGMSYGMDLKYNENTGEIEAYGEKIKIDKDKRKIEGLEVEFKKYEHMINAAILTAYLKKNYSGKCINNEPFHLNGDWQGDINVNTGNGDKEAVDGTGNGGRIVGVTAGGIAGILTGIYGGLQAGAAVGISGGIVGYMAGNTYDTNNIMHDLMPELDSDYGKKSLAAYLNKMDCRKTRNQSAEEIAESPIREEIIECMNEIQNTNKELTERGGNRKLNAIQDPNDEKKYTIKAYGRDFSAEVTGEKGNRKIKILGISGGNPTIKTDMGKGDISNLELPLKEGCFMSCFLGFLLSNKDIIHKGTGYPRFEYKSRGLGIKKGIYFNNASTISIDYDTRILRSDKFESRMPTLFQEKNRNKLLEFLNDGITDDSNISIWKKLN